MIKYSMLGCIRLIAQFIAYELMLTTPLLFAVFDQLLKLFDWDAYNMWYIDIDRMKELIEMV